VYFLGVKSVGV